MPPNRPMRALFFVSMLLSAGSAAADEPVFPGDDWAVRQPAAVGLDADRLAEFSRYVGGRGCVVRHGYLVYSWGDVSRRADVASAAKPWYSYFLFKALEDERIGGFDERVVRWEPRLENINRGLGFKDRGITWRHLANQTSCYQLAEKPGEAYCYNDWQMALLWDTLFTKVYGANYENVDEKVLRPLLADPLGCQDRPTMMAFGARNRPGRLAVSVRDFARFGLLYLRGGNWRGTQLLSKQHAAMAVSDPVPNSVPRAGKQAAVMIAGQRSIGSRSMPDNQTEHFGSYSWLWWINGTDADGTRMWPDAPADTYGAFGHGGPRAMWVIPSLDIVVSYNDATMRRWVNGEDGPTNQAMKLLVAAVVDKSAEQQKPTALPQRQQAAHQGRNQVGPVCRAGPLRTLRFVQPGKANRSLDANTDGRAKNPCDQGPARQAGPTQQNLFIRWSRVEFSFQGPDSQGRGQSNPFALALDVDFTSPSGKLYTVPGFYDGDGRGGLDGDVWKVRFSADEVGRWTFRTRCEHERLNDQAGAFTVAPVVPDAAGFWKAGRLEYRGTAENGLRYLKFRDGPYWLKAGCDDPENFLGGYRNYGTPQQRAAAIDYLAGHGINSLYIMTHNVGGDDNDVWPWLGRTPADAGANAGREARFDVAKLEEWRQLFEHMQTRGVVPYLVLEDDSAFKGYDHRRYYRELIARFGYLPALVFNLGEEANENYRLEESLKHLATLAELDPYNHPCGIHNVNRPTAAYIDSPHVDFTAIQTGSPGSRRGLEHAVAHNQMALDWIAACRERKQRVLVVNFDEGRPEEDRRAWWSAYLGGGVWEAHVIEPYDRPHAAWESVWRELGGTRAFMESLPFWEMHPDNRLVTAGRAFCLAKSGEAYALYLPKGGQIAVRLAEDRTYEVAWWDPSNTRDGKFRPAGQISGGEQRFTAPGPGDWALRILARKPE